jgi:hypothetical protein
MIGFARFTAIIFMLLGVALIVGGAVIAVGGFVRPPVSAPTVPGLTPNLSALFAFAGTIAGAAVAFPGLLLAAVGQVLWLIAGMAYQARLANEYMAELVRRMGNANR